MKRLLFKTAFLASVCGWMLLAQPHRADANNCLASPSVSNCNCYSVRSGDAFTAQYNYLGGPTYTGGMVFPDENATYSDCASALNSQVSWAGLQACNHAGATYYVANGHWYWQGSYQGEYKIGNIFDASSYHSCCTDFGLC